MRGFVVLAAALACAAPATAQTAEDLTASGAAKYEAKDLAGALADFRRAAELDPGNADRWLNVGVVEQQSGAAAQAEASFARVLEGPGKTSDSAWIVAWQGLLSSGVRRFQSNDLAGAEAVFARMVAIEPSSRDVRYNYALALFRQGKWDELEGTGKTIVRLDPLNENAHILLFQAQKALSDAVPVGPERDGMTKAALATLEAVEAMPVKLDELLLQPVPGGVRITGKVTGNAATPGSRVILAFSFFGRGSRVGATTIPIAAPAKGETKPLVAMIPLSGPHNSWRYTVQ